jgi:hypothetical protein
MISLTLFVGEIFSRCGFYGGALEQTEAKEKLLSASSARTHTLDIKPQSEKLALLKNKRDTNPPKKHGNIPL